MESELEQECKSCGLGTPVFGGWCRDCCPSKELAAKWENDEKIVARFEKSKALALAAKNGNGHKANGKAAIYLDDDGTPTVSGKKLGAARAKDAALATEKEKKKKEAFRERIGRQELGHWVDKIETKEGETMDFVVRVTSRNAATVKPKPQHWLWTHRIPAGAITWAVGKPGNAKSLFATDLVARVSSGRDFPDGAKTGTGRKKS